MLEAWVVGYWEMEWSNVVVVIFAVDEVVSFFAGDATAVEEAANAIGFFTKIVASSGVSRKI